MYVRRKVFSILQDENGEERLFSVNETELTQKEYTSKRTKKLRDRLLLSDIKDFDSGEHSIGHWFASGEVEPGTSFPFTVNGNSEYGERKDEMQLAKKILSKGNHKLSEEELEEMNKNFFLTHKKRAVRYLNGTQKRDDLTKASNLIANDLIEKHNIPQRPKADNNLNVRISEGLAGANNMKISREEKSRLLEKANERKARLEKIDKDKKLKKGLVIGLGSAAVVSGLTAGGIALHKHHKNKKKKSEEKED